MRFSPARGYRRCGRPVACQHGKRRRNPGDDLGRADRRLQTLWCRSSNAPAATRSSPPLRPVDGHHRQRHSCPPGARRARRCADHGQLCARRSRQAGQGRRPTVASTSSKSAIGVAVKSGAPKPDISSAEAVKRTLLAAKTIAYSDSASGVYVSTRNVRKTRHRRGDEGQGEGKFRRRRSARSWRAATPRSVSADQRAKAGGRHRQSSGRYRTRSKRSRCFSGHRQRLERTGGRQGADPISRLARGPRRDRQERHGADCSERDELAYPVGHFVCVRIGVSFRPLLS